MERKNMPEEPIESNEQKKPQQGWGEYHVSSPFGTGSGKFGAKEEVAPERLETPKEEEKKTLHGGKPFSEWLSTFRGLSEKESLSDEEKEEKNKSREFLYAYIDDLTDSGELDEIYDRFEELKKREQELVQAAKTGNDVSESASNFAENINKEYENARRLTEEEKDDNSAKGAREWFYKTRLTGLSRETERLVDEGIHKEEEVGKEEPREQTETEKKLARAKQIIVALGSAAIALGLDEVVETYIAHKVKAKMGGKKRPPEEVRPTEEEGKPPEEVAPKKEDISRINFRELRRRIVEEEGEAKLEELIKEQNNRVKELKNKDVFVRGAMMEDIERIIRESTWDNYYKNLIEHARLTESELRGMSDYNDPRYEGLAYETVVQVANKLSSDGLRAKEGADFSTTEYTGFDDYLNKKLKSKDGRRSLGERERRARAMILDDYEGVDLNNLVGRDIKKAEVPLEEEKPSEWETHGGKTFLEALEVLEHLNAFEAARQLTNEEMIRKNEVSSIMNQYIKDLEDKRYMGKIYGEVNKLEKIFNALKALPTPDRVQNFRREMGRLDELKDRIDDREEELNEKDFPVKGARTWVINQALDMFQEVYERLGLAPSGEPEPVDRMTQALEGLSSAFESQTPSALRLPTKEILAQDAYFNYELGQRISERLAKEQGKTPKKLDLSDAEKAEEFEKLYEDNVKRWFNKILRQLWSYPEQFEEHRDLYGALEKAITQLKYTPETNELGDELGDKLETQRALKTEMRIFDLYTPDKIYEASSLMTTTNLKRLFTTEGVAEVFKGYWEDGERYVDTFYEEGHKDQELENEIKNRYVRGGKAEGINGITYEEDGNVLFLDQAISKVEAKLRRPTSHENRMKIERELEGLQAEYERRRIAGSLYQITLGASEHFVGFDGTGNLFGRRVLNVDKDLEANSTVQESRGIWSPDVGKYKGKPIDLGFRNCIVAMAEEWSEHNAETDDDMPIGIKELGAQKKKLDDWSYRKHVNKIVKEEIVGILGNVEFWNKLGLKESWYQTGCMSDFSDTDETRVALYNFFQTPTGDAGREAFVKLAGTFKQQSAKLNANESLNDVARYRKKFEILDRILSYGDTREGRIQFPDFEMDRSLEMTKWIDLAGRANMITEEQEYELYKKYVSFIRIGIPGTDSALRLPMPFTTRRWQRQERIERDISSSVRRSPTARRGISSSISGKFWSTLGDYIKQELFGQRR